MAIPPVLGSTGEIGGPDGYSYGAVIVAIRDETFRAVEETLRGIRFSGWIAPPDNDWLVIVGDPGAGVVASERRGVVEVGALLANRVTGPVLAVRVRRDRQLVLVGWRDGAEIGRYSSDPSLEPDADPEVIAEPVGVASAVPLAAMAGRADAAEGLTDLLAEELDPDSVFESERLRQVLRLLGMPHWIVAAGALPHDIPTGPRARELARMRAGVPGAAGLARNVFVRRLRRHRVPPPAISDPPRQGQGLDGIEPWMF